MIQMNKIITLALFVMVASMLLVSCSKQETTPGDTDATPEPTEAPTTEATTDPIDDSLPDFENTDDLESDLEELEDLADIEI